MEPFTVAVPDAVLDDLNARLDRTRVPAAVEGIGWDQGTDRDVLLDLIDHWRDGFDWRSVERRINTFPQLVTEVDGQRIHLLHVRSDDPDALPLVITHGWPSSVLEFLDVIEPLARDFHLVIPSLPGFTFSGPTSERGWHPRRVADAWATVMGRLGYERYGLQGGDWGSLVSSNLADLHPDRVAGLHVTLPTGARPVAGAEITEDEQRGLERLEQWRKTGVGYQQIQQTRPQSLGFALEDSPAGLAAWIVEKLREWSERDLEAFTFDQLLATITAYWVTATATSSLRIYWEMRQAGRAAVPSARITVPTAVANFPGEVGNLPRAWAEQAYDVVRWTHPPAGGHFAALEAPDAFVDDVRDFFLSLDR